MPTAAAASSSTARLRIYHVSGWGLLASLRAGDAFELVPGSQHAEGPGVYFSEGAPRLTAAEGAAGRPTAIVEVELDVVSAADAADSERPDVIVLGGAGPEYDHRTLSRVYDWMSQGVPVLAMHRSTAWTTADGPWTPSGWQRDAGSGRRTPSASIQ